MLFMNWRMGKLRTCLEKVRVSGIIVMITGFLFGCSLLPQEEEALKPPLVEPAKQRTELAEVSRGDISQTVKGTAVFEPTHLVYQQFRESGGIVEEVFVKAGDTVEKGDVLVRLSLNDIDLQLKERTLEVEKKSIELQNAILSRDDENIRIKKLEHEIAQLKKEKAQAAFDSLHLYADMSGQVVFMADIEPGDRVAQWEAIVNIADPTEMRLFYSGGRNLHQVEVGMDVEVTLGNEKVIGTVVQTPSTAPRVSEENLRRQYDERIYIELPEIPANADFGDYADIFIVLKERKDTLVIPSRALRTYMGREYVQVMDGESRQELDVETGIKTATEVEILKGLEEGQKVILQ